MEFIKITDQERAIAERVDAQVQQFSLMNRSERDFLVALLERYKPRKVLELGVAAGSSAVVILNVLSSFGGQLYSIDYSTDYYMDHRFKTGFVVDSFPELKAHWTLYTGALAAGFMDEIGPDIDFCFIDTMHCLPGEILDLLMVLPYLKADCVVVLYDINQHTWELLENHCNALLFSTLRGTKFLPASFESLFLQIPQQRGCSMFLPNIGAVQLEGTALANAFDLVNLLSLQWHYLPTPEDLLAIKATLLRFYPEYCYDFFEKILKFQQERFFPEVALAEQNLADTSAEKAVQTAKTSENNADAIASSDSNRILKPIAQTCSSRAIGKNGLSSYHAGPRLTCLMPVYNTSSDLLRESISSILEQTFEDFTFLIVDDGSQPYVGEVVADFKDTRLKYHPLKDHQGISKALNYGLDLCQTELVARMDSDDVALPERFERQVAYLDAHPELDLIGTWVDTEVGVIKAFERVGLFDLIKENVVGLFHPTIMFRLASFNQYNLRYDPLFDHCEDIELFIRAFRHLNIGNMQEVLLMHRQDLNKLTTELYQKQQNIAKTLRARIANLITGDPAKLAKIKELQRQT